MGVAAPLLLLLLTGLLLREVLFLHAYVCMGGQWSDNKWVTTSRSTRRREGIIKYEYMNVNSDLHL